MESEEGTRREVGLSLKLAGKVKLTVREAQIALRVLIKQS